MAAILLKPQHADIICHPLNGKAITQNTYRKLSNIRRTKSQNLNASRLTL